MLTASTFQPCSAALFFIHPVKVGGEQRGFIAAGAGADFEHRGLGIGAVTRQQRDGEAAFRDRGVWP